MNVLLQDILKHTEKAGEDCTELQVSAFNILKYGHTWRCGLFYTYYAFLINHVVIIISRFHV